MAGMIVEVIGTLPTFWRDYTPGLLHGTLTVKRYTIDFDIIDPATNISGFNTNQLASANLIRIVALDWAGTIASVESYDPTPLVGHVGYRISATSSVPAMSLVAGSTQTLSDVMSTVTDAYLLEDGSGTYLLEDGTLTQPGSYEMEGALVPIADLRVRTQINGAVTTLGQTFSIGQLVVPTNSVQGSLTMYTGGLWPGNQFTLVSTNQSIASTVYTVTETTITFPTNLTQPTFMVQFGLTSADVPWNLNTWKKV